MGLYRVAGAVGLGIAEAAPISATPISSRHVVQHEPTERRESHLKKNKLSQNRSTNTIYRIYRAFALQWCYNAPLYSEDAKQMNIDFLGFLGFTKITFPQTNQFDDNSSRFESCSVSVEVHLKPTCSNPTSVVKSYCSNFWLKVK